MGFFTKYFEYDGKPSRQLDNQGNIVYSLYFGHIDTEPLRRLYNTRNINTEYNRGRRTYTNYGVEWDDSPLVLDVEILSETPLNIYDDSRTYTTSYTTTIGGESTDGRFIRSHKGDVYYLQDWLFGSTEYKKLYAGDSYDENITTVYYDPSIISGTFRQYVECVFVNPEQIIHSGKVYGWKCQCVLSKPMATLDEMEVSIEGSPRNFDEVLDFDNDGITYNVFQITKNPENVDRHPTKWYMKDGDKLKPIIDVSNYSQYYWAVFDATTGALSRYQQYASQAELLDVSWNNIYILAPGSTFTNVIIPLLSNGTNDFYVKLSDTVSSYSEYISFGLDRQIAQPITGSLNYALPLLWDEEAYYFCYSVGSDADGRYYLLDEEEYRFANSLYIKERGISSQNFHTLYKQREDDYEQTETIYIWSDADEHIYPTIEYYPGDYYENPITHEILTPPIEKNVSSPTLAYLDKLVDPSVINNMFYRYNAPLEITNVSDNNNKLVVKDVVYGMKTVIDNEMCSVSGKYNFTFQIPIIGTVSIPVITDSSAGVENQNYLKLVKGKNELTIKGCYQNMRIKFNLLRYLI